MNFLNENDFDSNIIEESNKLTTYRIGLDNGLMLNRQHAITWTNGDHQNIGLRKPYYTASLSPSELNHRGPWKSELVKHLKEYHLTIICFIIIKDILKKKKANRVAKFPIIGACHPQPLLGLHDYPGRSCNVVRA